MSLSPIPGLQTSDPLRLIFRAVILLVFLGMNLLYQLFWKNSAKADYFESKGITNLPPDKMDQLEFSPPQTRSHFCPCGYDLQPLNDERLLTDGEARAIA